jgi:hypothetical protein
MAKAPIDIRSLARAYTEANIRALGGFAGGGDVPPAIRIQAIGMLLDRGWGKAAQAHTGADGEGDITITIRNIIEEKKQTK